MRQAVLEATTECRAVDGGDAGNVEVFEVVECLVGFMQPRGNLFVLLILVV